MTELCPEDQKMLEEWEKWVDGQKKDFVRFLLGPFARFLQKSA
jgi:hypothetical protein